MNRLRVTGLSIAAAILVMAGTPQPLEAQLFTWEQTRITTEKPLRVGDAVLEPGTYDFRILTANGVLTVMDHETGEVVAKAQTIPHQREKMDVGDTPTFMFYPMAPGIPQTLRTWFAPNNVYGRDILYGPEVEREIAIALTRTKEQPEEVVAEVQETTTEPAPLVAEARPAPVEQLPLTASQVPLAAALGGLSLAAAGLLAGARKLAA